MKFILLFTILFLVLCNSNETNCKILKSKETDYKKNVEQRDGIRW